MTDCYWSTMASNSNKLKAVAKMLTIAVRTKCRYGGTVKLSWPNKVPKWKIWLHISFKSYLSHFLCEKEAPHVQVDRSRLQQQNT